jgi:hypothetical protein
MVEVTSVVAVFGHQMFSQHYTFYAIQSQGDMTPQFHQKLH